MGLEDFISDDNDTSSSNSSTSSKTVKKTKVPNQPSNTHQSFGPEEHVAPRQIKLQIKSILPGAIKQLSTSRTDSGEVVFYGSKASMQFDNKTLVVFTGIRAFDSEPPYSEDLDILIQPVDLKEKRMIGEGVTVEYKEGWTHKLVDVLANRKEQFREEHAG